MRCARWAPSRPRWSSSVPAVYTQDGPPSRDPSRLVSALMSGTPMASDLEELTDTIGGRTTGSTANLASVEWALRKFREAGIDVRKEAFRMPARWDERSASASITASSAPGSTGQAVTFSPRIAAMPFSIGTPPAGLTAPLVDGGDRAGRRLREAGNGCARRFVLVETEELAGHRRPVSRVCERDADRGHRLPTWRRGRRLHGLTSVRAALSPQRIARPGQPASAADHGARGSAARAAAHPAGPARAPHRHARHRRRRPVPVRTTSWERFEAASARTRSS